MPCSNLHTRMRPRIRREGLQGSLFTSALKMPCLVVSGKHCVTSLFQARAPWQQVRVITSLGSPHDCAAAGDHGHKPD